MRFIDLPSDLILPNGMRVKDPTGLADLIKNQPSFMDEILDMLHNREIEMWLRRNGKEILAKYVEEIRLTEVNSEHIKTKLYEALTEPISLFAINENDKFGFIDRTGRIVVKPQYDDYHDEPFEGLLGINIGRKEYTSEHHLTIREGGKWGYIDLNGRCVITPQFDDAKRFSEGFARVNVGAKPYVNHMLGGKWGFINKRGELVIEPRFDDAQDFQEGLACVRIGDKWGYIDSSGKFIIDPQFNYADNFSGGVARVCMDKNTHYYCLAQDYESYEFYEGKVASDNIHVDGCEWGLIDKTGRYILEPKYYWIEQFNEGLGIVLFPQGKVVNRYGPNKIYEKYKCTYINKFGDFVFDQQFDYAGNFQNGIAIVKINDKYGLIDNNGRFITELKFDYICFPFQRSEGLLQVAIDKKGDRKWGYINSSGKTIIEPQFDEVKDFSEGLAPVRLHSLWGYIDKTGNYRVRPKYRDAEVFSEGMAAVRVGDFWGFVNTNGDLVIEPRFQNRCWGSRDVTDFKGGLAKVWGPEKNSYGYINKKGQYVWKGYVKNLEYIDI